eukprot:3856085-Rhodomonas_salina.1
MALELILSYSGGVPTVAGTPHRGWHRVTVEGCNTSPPSKMKLWKIDFWTQQPKQPECENKSVNDDEEATCKKRKRGKEGEENLDLAGDGDAAARQQQEQTTQRKFGTKKTEQNSKQRNSETEAAKTSETPDVVGEIQERCVEFIRGIELLMPQPDQPAGEACHAVLIETFNSSKVFSRVVHAGSFEGRDQQTKAEEASRAQAEQELKQARLDCAQALKDLNISHELRKREKDARERAEQEIERVKQELQQARSECAKAVEDLNKTRAELAAAFPGGGGIAGTFPIASELRNAYRALCSQDLFNLSPGDLPSTVALFKEIFFPIFNESDDRFNKSQSLAKKLLYIRDGSEEEWKPVEGLIQKAMRLRRSAMFKLDGVEEWLIRASHTPQSPLCAVLRTNPGARPALLRSIQSLAYLMGCFHLSQPALCLDPQRIGKEVKYSPNLHEVPHPRMNAAFIRPLTSFDFPLVFSIAAGTWSEGELWLTVFWDDD